MHEAEYQTLSNSDVNWNCNSCNKGLQSFNTIEAVDVFHFDFQKNLPTPKLPVGEQFYQRLLWTYLFGVFSASTQLMTAFMWHELLAKRGANDVISCLLHFINETPFGRTGAKHSIWWPDNCPGQNKNNCLIWFFQDLICCGVYSSIDYKFLVPGHTYSPTDRHFAIIEKHADTIETVYTPKEWYQHVSETFVSSQSKVYVIEMQQSYFCNYYEHLNHLYTERMQDTSKKPLNFHSAVWFNFGYGKKVVDGAVVEVDHHTEVWVRHSYDIRDSSNCIILQEERETSISTLNALYSQYPLPIKRAKAQDVSKLVHSYVPAHLQVFYANLSSIDENTDDDTENDT